MEINRIYLKEDVLEKARERISLVFDNFENIVVSASSGKDSTVLFWLAVEAAEKRNRNINLFFLDQEAEYRGSIELMEKMMRHPRVVPLWYQVPINLTNATSYEDCMFRAWEEGREWIREKDKLAIQKIDGKYPDRFYSFFNWIERGRENTAFLIGIRTEESGNRLGAVTQNPGWKDILWSTKTKGKNTYRFYPIYDWGVGDIWKYIKDNNISYNTIYDKMFQANKSGYKKMRVSNLIHEKSFKCLSDLQIYEPDTFNKLIKRMKGVHVASIYANDEKMFNAIELPVKFSSWLEFRDYLLETTPLQPEHRERFIKRFKLQEENEEMHRRQVRQIFLNDYENSLNVSKNSKTDENLRKNLKEKMWDKL